MQLTDVFCLAGIGFSLKKKIKNKKTLNQWPTSGFLTSPGRLKVSQHWVTQFNMAATSWHGQSSCVWLCRLWLQDTGSPFCLVPTTHWYQAPSPLLLTDNTCPIHKGIGLAAPNPYISAPFEYNPSTCHKPTSLYHLPGHISSLGINKVLSNSVCHSVIRGLCLSLINQSKTVENDIEISLSCLGLQNLLWLFQPLSTFLRGYKLSFKNIVFRTFGDGTWNW